MGERERERERERKERDRFFFKLIRQRIKREKIDRIEKTIL